MANKERKVYIFSSNTSKYDRESSNLKKFVSKVRTFGFDVFHFDTRPIRSSSLVDCECLMFFGGSPNFNMEELNVLRRYVRSGGNIFLCLHERWKCSPVERLLENFGIFVREDSVIGSVFGDYFHPKEVFISKGVVNRSLKVKEEEDLGFVFPYGCSLNVKSPSAPLLSTGPLSYPVNQSICCVHEESNDQRGKIIVFGSCDFFNDRWLEEKDNTALCMNLMNIFFEDLELNQIDLLQPEISHEHRFVPDSSLLSKELKGCLESKEKVGDFTDLFDGRNFSFETNLIPEVISAYRKLKVKSNGRLSLIPPSFETPLPSLTPAVFHPILNDPPPPPLDLFDLDEKFAQKEIRFAQLLNTCTEKEHLKYFVLNAANIFDISPKLKSSIRNDPKVVLEFVFRQISKFRQKNFGQN